MEYQFYNGNPLGEIEEDCVTKAISFALQEDYYKISDKLYAIANLYECERLCVCCYQHLLNDYYKLEEIQDCKGMTVEEFANTHPYGTYLLRGNGHLTVIYNSRLYDLFDCRNMIITNAWRTN